MLNEVARLPDRQVIEFWLIEGGDYQAYQNDQAKQFHVVKKIVDGQAKRVIERDPNWQPSVFVLQRVIGDIAVFDEPLPVTERGKWDPETMKDWIEKWDHWDSYVQQEVYPEPVPEYPNAHWYPAQWTPKAETFDTPSKNLERGQINVTGNRVVWVEDAPDAQWQDGKADEVTIARDGSNRVTSVTRKTRP